MGLGMMMVDDGGGRGVKNNQKRDDVINGRPLLAFCCFVFLLPGDSQAFLVGNLRFAQKY